MHISCHVKGYVLHVIFPPSQGDTWESRQYQFLRDQRHPEKIYSNPDRCLDILRASARYEGENQFVGFNFPSYVLRKEDTTLYPYKEKYPIKYVIAYMKGDINTIEHEKRHATFYINKKYRIKVKRSWNKMKKSDPKLFKKINTDLTKKGYDPKVFIDEYQAYYPHLI
jgi:hypothetical protein